MEKSLKGTKTEENLQKAFREEATALVKYTIFADESEFKQIENKLVRTAKMELEHAEVFLELLGGVGDDLTNLKNSVALEGFASQIDYPSAAKVARDEGFDEIADKFEKVAEIEARHKKEFLELHDKLKNNTLLKSTSKGLWKCLECGYIHEGTEPPEECPVCEHSKNHFKMI